ncbi:MAG: hypothetical protein QNK11_00705 [Legionella sp.]|nr:hypothetical protein [Legionella sp.]
MSKDSARKARENLMKAIQKKQNEEHANVAQENLELDQRAGITKLPEKIKDEKKLKSLNDDLRKMGTDAKRSVATTYQEWQTTQGEAFKMSVDLAYLLHAKYQGNWMIKAGQGITDYLKGNKAVEDKINLPGGEDKILDRMIPIPESPGADGLDTGAFKLDFKLDDLELEPDDKAAYEGALKEAFEANLIAVGYKFEKEPDSEDPNRMILKKSSDVKNPDADYTAVENPKEEIQAIFKDMNVNDFFESGIKAKTQMKQNYADLNPPANDDAGVKSPGM